MMEKKNKESRSKRQKTLVGTRGRTFEGTVTKKFPHRVVVELERTIYDQKYERFYKKKTKLHARIPEGMEIEVGDIVKVRQTRPLSKIVNFLVIEKVKSAGVEEK